MSFVNENIRIMRKRMKLTQEEFAELIGINRKVVGSYEENRATPPLDNLSKISRLFGITLDQLMNHRFAEEPADVPLFSKEVLETKQAVEEVLPKLTEPVVSQASATEKKKPFSRTGEPHLKLVEPQSQPSSKKMSYVSYKYFDKYILDDDFQSRIGEPSFPLFEDKKGLRAFEVPADSHIEEGVLIAERVTDFSTLSEEEYYLIVSLKKGFLLRKVTLTTSGDLKVKADKEMVLKLSEIKEVWKPVGFVSKSLPKAEPDLSALSAKINALKSDFDSLL